MTFLLDAFRRMLSFNSAVVAISIKQVTIHVITFILICVTAVLICSQVYIEDNKPKVTITLECELATSLCCVISNVPLLMILFTIMNQTTKL